MRRTIKFLTFTLILVILCVGGYFIYGRGRPAPVPVKDELYKGVIYRRMVRVVPHSMVVHVIEIDSKQEGIRFLVTPPDSDGERPLLARTTSQFLEEFDLQIAVNGDAFAPWWSRSVADYYPHVGDPVAPLGFSASNGDVYWKGENAGDVGIEPTLYISRRNALSFNRRPGNVYSALSGDRMLILQGDIVSGLDDKELEPRTAIGVNRNARYLYLVVVDGRQPFYSNGATMQELAELMKGLGAYFAMSMDGGGSSTLVVEGEDGLPQIMNSPIDNYIPGRERPVGNHLGVYIE